MRSVIRAALIQFPSPAVSLSNCHRDWISVVYIRFVHRIISLHAGKKTSRWLPNIFESSIQLLALTESTDRLVGVQFARRGRRRIRRSPATAPRDDIDACRLQDSRPRGRAGGNDRLRGTTSWRRMDVRAVATRCGIIGFEKRSARAFWRARARRPLFGISQAHEAATADGALEGTVQQWRPGRRRRPGWVPSAALLTSLVVVISSAGEIDRRTRQWMLYTWSRWCAALVSFRVVAQAFFWRFSFPAHRVEHSRSR